MKLRNRWPARLDLWIIAAALFILYLSLAAAKPQHIFWSLDEGGKWIYIENVLRVADPRAPLIYPGRALDPDLENIALFFYGRKGTDIYTWWPVGFPLLTLPFYQVLGWIGLYVLPALAGAATAFLTGKITQKVSGGSWLLSASAALIVGLATPVVFYSTMFWEHTLSVACITAALYLLVREPEKPPVKSLLLAGVLASLAVFFRTEAALFFAGVGLVFLFFHWRRVVPIAVAGMVTTLAWMAFNYLMLGHFLSPNQASVSMASTFYLLNTAGKKVIPYILFNSPAIGAFDLGRNLLILGTLLAGGAVLTGIFRKTRLLSVFLSVGVALVCLYVLVQPQLYRSVHGFVLISPLVVLFSWVYGTGSWQKFRSFWLMCLAGLVAFSIVFVMRGWIAAGGLQWGPRYMLGLYPVMTIAALVGIQDYLQRAGAWRKKLMIGAVSISLLVGLFFEVRGYVTMMLTMQLYQRSAQSVEALDGEIISTSCTWMPMVMPDLYWKGTIFQDVASQSWLQNLKQSGRKEYLNLTLPACSTTPIDQVMRVYQNNPSGLVIERVIVEE